MSRLRTLKTLDQLAKLQKKTKVQITVQQVINSRVYLDNGLGWSKVIVSDELKEEIAESVSQLFGGRYTTRAAMKRTLLNERPQHWGLERIFVAKYGKNAARLSYCVGQDGQTEATILRNALK